MATFSQSDEMKGALFVDADLRGARFVRADLSGVVMRGVDVHGADIDAPWLFNGESFLRVNGVDVIPLVEAELNRRFPGRADRRAGDPDGLRAAWATLERTWAATLERAAAMPAGTVDVSVGGEWSFAQTLRHLVLATDTWLGRGHPGDRTAIPPHRFSGPRRRGRRLGHVDLHDGHTVVRRSARGPGGSRRDGARLPRHSHIRRAGRDVQEPVGPRIPGDHPFLPARDPRGGVGAPPLRRTRPRRDRGEVRRMSRLPQHAVIQFVITVGDPKCSSIVSPSEHSSPDSSPNGATHNERVQWFTTRNGCCESPLATALLR